MAERGRVYAVIRWQRDTSLIALVTGKGHCTARGQKRRLALSGLPGVRRLVCLDKFVNPFTG